VNTGELYDVVTFESKGKAGVNVQALRSLWDQKTDHHSDCGDKEMIQQQNELQPPALPPKSKSRKLTSTVSAGAMSLSQAVPPVPKRGVPLSHSLSESLHSTSHPCEAQTDPNKTERPRGNANPVLMADRAKDSLSFITSSTSYHDGLHPAGAPGILYSELMQTESRNNSLPRLDNNMEEEYSNQFNSPSTSYSPAQLKRVTCQTYSLHEPSNGRRSEGQTGRPEMLKSNPFYQTSEGAGQSSTQPGGDMYAEVPQWLIPPSRRLPDDTYEPIPGKATTIQGNTYETLNDMKNKKSKSTWGKNNITWKKFIPDYKKK
ncbi:hypothetical protein LDENG_00013360, partial [Lucifuga dentata]